MTSVVADLVLRTVEAAAEALSLHLLRLKGAADKAEDDAHAWHAVGAALDFGYDADLDDIVAPDQPVGFDHDVISRTFAEKLRAEYERFGRAGAEHRVSPFIWGADDERDTFSLYGSRDGEEAVANRASRASLIVQRLMKECRGYRNAQKATTSREDAPTFAIMPSPLQIAADLLTDPANLVSSEYAVAALRELMFEKLGAIGKSPDISHNKLADALGLITNRVRTNKPVEDNRAEVMLICHALAMKGACALRLPLNSETIELLQSDPWAVLTGGVGFSFNPRFRQLPDVGSLLNEFNALPIPIDGAGTVLDGGLRFSHEGLGVVAISGAFGAAKTSFALSLAAALAPLGCRTLFLSCEESVEDINARLLEARPEYLRRWPQYFRAGDQASDSSQEWFEAASLTSDTDFDVESAEFADDENFAEDGVAGREAIEPLSELGDVLSAALNEAIIFAPLTGAAELPRPRFARPIVIVDGLHQLLSDQTEEDLSDAFRGLLADCRRERAIFIFTYSDEDSGLRRLDYLCDLVFELGRVGFDSPEQRPTRILRLLKSRRQPTRHGAHVFHLQGPKSFRIKASVGARSDAAKVWRWREPDPKSWLLLLDERATRLELSERIQADRPLPHLRENSQILVKGRGSSGKAGFGLYLLHRRPIDVSLSPQAQRRLFERQGRPRTAEEAFLQSGLPMRLGPHLFESRVLVLSFLYQQQYYANLTARLRQRHGRKRPRRSYGSWEGYGADEIHPMPDDAITETIDLYPGMLRVEELLAKVESRLRAAELRGLPFTGVLIDGLHNVFVQYPALEDASAFWPELYGMLRRRSLTVVTTHTEFDISEPHPRKEHWSSSNLGMDFKFAQRKVAPLMSALVSAADYLFDLSADTDADGRTSSGPVRVTQLTALGADPLGAAFEWDRQNLSLRRTAAER